MKRLIVLTVIALAACTPRTVTHTVTVTRDVPGPTVQVPVPGPTVQVPVESQACHDLSVQVTQTAPIVDRWSADFVNPAITAQSQQWQQDIADMHAAWYKLGVDIAGCDPAVAQQFTNPTPTQ